jgi:Bacterial Ig-like domain (group 3)
MKTRLSSLWHEKILREYNSNAKEFETNESCNRKESRRRNSFSNRLRTVLGIFLAAAALASQTAMAADVLILGPTVPSGTASTEYKIITGSTTTAISGLGIMGLGLTADIVPATGLGSWVSPPQPYSAYKAIVLGDPTCASTTAPVAAAIANATGAGGWTAAVKGNVVIIGTDPSFHPGVSGGSGAQLWKSSIAFAVNGFPTDGTGAVLALSCYYNSAVANTPVPLLDGFGPPSSFKVQGGIPCAGDVDIVASSPALSGLTGGTGGTLSAWGCSVHEGFNSWPSGFIPLAIAKDVATPLKTYPPEAPKGFPYILARGKSLVTLTGGTLKICKVAGTGIPVGTMFNFTAGSSTVSVPAGPAPGGTCAIGPVFPVGTVVNVAEAVPAGNTVTAISVKPASQLVGLPSLPGGNVNVTIGAGVTEVTFTNNRTGFVEICKKGDVKGTFNFTINPGSIGPLAVPSGFCSPAIEVAAGPVIIRELTTPGTVMSGCATIPASQQLSCNLSTRSSIVSVVPGDESTMTIALITNAPSGLAGDFTPVSVRMKCSPEVIPEGKQIECAIAVSAAADSKDLPTGSVSILEGGETRGELQIERDGTALFRTADLKTGAHALVTVYNGDARFEKGISQQTNIIVEKQ